MFADDGLEDKGNEIVLKHQGIEQWIKLYSQQNRGVSGARNYGMQMAKGEMDFFRRQ